MIVSVSRFICVCTVLFTVLTAFSALAAAPEQASAPAEPSAEDTVGKPEDIYLAGYAQAVLDRQYPLSAPKLKVQDGVVLVPAKDLTPIQRDQVRRILAAVPGVREVRMVKPEPGQPEQVSGEVPEKIVFLPRVALFGPLIADPRWPHFAASWHFYQDDPELSNVGAVSFGENIPLLRYKPPFAGLLEFGIQAGVFAIFDMDAPSKDLINADYFVGFPFTYRYDDFSAMFRVYHQSSHLGDEYLLRDTTDRINLSYESLDLLLSYDLPWGFRPYLGGGWLFDTDPANLDPWTAQWGLEWRAPFTMWDIMRPVAAADFQTQQALDWNTSMSLRAGFQFEDPDFFSRRMMVLFEYYTGRSPNGQFYDRHIEYLGVGLHFFYD